ncbi:MAG: hypothetical protein HUJ90_01240 [Bacteroidales bacterium]|nr:hypothetical protein [Bacteroidales bacterium]
MKKGLFLTFALIICTLTMSAQSQELYFNTTPGKTLVFANHDPNGKLLNEYVETLKSYTMTDDDGSAEFEYDYINADGKSEFGNSKLSMIATMKKGKLSIRLSPFGKALQTQEFMGKGNAACIPANSKVGDIIPDNTITVNVGLTVKNNQQNMKAIAEESVTVPAGTFKCIVVTGEEVMQGNTCKYKSSLSKGIGLVKQEIYDESGKLIRVLTLKEIKK